MTRTTLLFEAVFVPARSVLGAELSEGEAALRVFLAAGGLIVLGVALLVMTVWWWRSTRPEPPALAPLEVMGDKKWLTAGEAERRRIVEEFRPDGAVPMRDLVVAPAPVDLAGLARDVPSFDDLRDVSLDSERPPSVDLEQLELAPSPSVSWSPSPSVPWPPADADVSAAGEVQPQRAEGPGADSADSGDSADSADSGDSGVEARASRVVAEPERELAGADVGPSVDADEPVDEPVDEGAYDATIAQVRPSHLSDAAGRD